jgi:hypothetical protein
MFYNSRSRRVSGSVIPLGFILVVTIITFALVIFTTTTLPTLSKQSEVDAHRDVETDFIKMDTAVYRAATTGIPQPVVLGNRVQYPPSITPLKTPTPLLRTVGPYNLSIENGIYTANSTSYSAERDTNHIMFSRDYNFFTTARDFGYEHGIFYTQAPRTPRGDASIIARDKQTVVNGKTITFVAVEGDLSFSRPAPTQVAVSAEDEEERHATITNDAGQHVELVVPTRLPKSEWETLLESEDIANGGHVTDVRYRTTNPDTGSDDGMNYVIIELEQGIEYDINLYTVAVEKY